MSNRYILTSSDSHLNVAIIAVPYREIVHYHRLNTWVILAPIKQKFSIQRKRTSSYLRLFFMYNSLSVVIAKRRRDRKLVTVRRNAITSSLRNSFFICIGCNPTRAQEWCALSIVSRAALIRGEIFITIVTKTPLTKFNIENDNWEDSAGSIIECSHI